MNSYLKRFQKAIFLLPIYFSITCLIAQVSTPEYLYVYPSDPSAYPAPPNLTNNSALAAIFTQFQVYKYVQGFPGSQSTELQNAYEVHCTGDLTALQSSLNSSGLFSYTEKAMVYVPLNGCPTGCANPVGVNDPNPGYQLDITEARCAWSITKGDPNVVIAVVDTEFDLTNPDLANKFVSVTGTNSTFVHGTPVSGMIVAEHDNNFGCAGLAPDCRLAGYVVSGPLWNAVWQAYLDGNRIINISWYGIGTDDMTATLALKEMTENGTLVVLGAGNEYPWTDPVPYESYANIPGVIIASSVSSDGSVHVWVNYNEFVDICAPGNAVAVLHHGTAWGTSFSAPSVCAAAGLLLSVNDCLTPAEMEIILKETACPMLPHPQVPANAVGAGSLNLFQAVTMAQGRSGNLTQDETWNDLTYVPSDLVVPSGITLTINGTTKFSEGAGLIVEPGGRVNLRGTLTSSCAGPWNGVTVKGISTESQYKTGKHGRIYTYDGAVIENATTGVRLWDGGMIYANGTSVLNNGTGVEYCPYSNFWPFSNPVQPRDHFGWMRDCYFGINDDFKKAADINAFVQMAGVRGIKMQGCSFVNKRTIKNPMGNNAYGYGIKATDSRFTVSSLGVGNTFPPTSFDHSDFYGLGYGIYIASAQTPVNNNGTPNQTHDDFVNLPYTVQQASFTDCIYGIHNRFVSQGVIVGNTFNLGHLPPASPLSGDDPYTTNQYGIFFENGANGFEIQENKFLGTDGNVKNTHGSYCQNLGWFNNDIRRNTYTDVKDGNIADEDNAIVSPTRGLYYLCNSNSNKVFDFFVFEGADIRKNQGVELTNGNFQAAGNTFTNANAPDGDFSNGGPLVTYFHNGAAEKPTFFSNLDFKEVPINNCEVEYCLPPQG